MAKEFEPYIINSKANRDFSTWEYQAKEEATQSLTREEQLSVDLEQLKQEAIEKGYSEGLAKAKAEIDQKKAELRQWIGLMQKPVQLLDDRLTQELIQTVIWLSQHCISVELSAHPEKLRDLIRAIKDELPSLQGNKVFAMHPDDIAWLEAELGETMVSGLQEILTPDPTLNRGDFYLKSEHSELDGRIQTRLITLFTKYIDKDNLITPIESLE